jgi:alkylation response protein AidB-like acyl-CoA dehydrogenase/flavin-dependent dehydrogenase/ferredoxin-like protein FixX
MTVANFDVVIVGAGAAGLTAAIGLARAGVRVAAVEAAAFPGAENWSGCVYFAENLAHPDILGEAGVEGLAWERRLVERGFFATDGHGLLGLKYRDREAFRHCYTVLRPIYDHHLSQVALRHGVALLTATTAESLIRENGRVIGVCTNRGPLYAPLTFLAEGDASNLVSREGYERSRQPQDSPKFLQGIKQVIELPPRAIEERFAVGHEEGVAYEMLLRNGTLRGKNVHLNMGGFVYANRQSLSIGLVLPADNLHHHFDGDPNLLMEWFLHLPTLQPWFEGAVSGPFGAKLIRGGGIKEVPTLVDEGLAIGGAASGIGIDFPYPNFTGPATAMGLLLTQAVQKIRAAGGSFTRDELTTHYLEPLQRTHYYRDVEFLREWPGYVKKTSFFFGNNVDLALGSAYVWTRPGKGLSGRTTDWLHLVQELTGGQRRTEMRTDHALLHEALHVSEMAPVPSPWRLLLDGALNLFRDALGYPRALPGRGDITLHYSIAGGAEPSGLPPAAVRSWLERYAPAVAAAARIVYRNDAVPLSRKLPAATRLLTRHVSLLDFARLLGQGIRLGTEWALGRTSHKRPQTSAVAADYFSRARKTADLTPAIANASPAWDARLAQLNYDTVKDSHIHVLWPQDLAARGAVVKAGLFHVCPAHVYEARVSATGQVQVVVNFENCIKCETCWRTSDIVDWGRDGRHRFVYAVHSPVTPKLLAEMDRAGRAQTTQPYSAGETEKSDRDQITLDVLRRKLREFEGAVAEEPRTLDRDRAAHLHMLARYIERVAATRSAGAAEEPSADRAAEALRIAGTLVEHVQAGRYAWAAGDARLLRFHYLPSPSSSGAPRGSLTDTIAARLDQLLPQSTWRDLEQQKSLTPDQDAGLRKLIAEVPLFSDGKLRWEECLLSPSRTVLLAELATRDPSLAYRVANHLWARDLAEVAGGDLQPIAVRWARAEEWASTAVPGQDGEALLVPASAASVLVIQGDAVGLGAKNHNVTPQKALGLRGAGLARIQAKDHLVAAETRGAYRIYEKCSSSDLIAIARGMADYLCRRALDHAGSRVQFPGLFHDEQSRDTIAKFGAIKKMLAEMAAGRAVIAALQRKLGPDLARTPVLLSKAVATDLLGTAPGSLSYNAGQIFGGTGYSEDDTLSKMYRDAATLRFLGVPNAEIYAEHGKNLLERWTADGACLSRLPEEDAIFEQIALRQALVSESQQLQKYAGELVERVNAWKFSADTLPPFTAIAAVQEALGRHDALLLASKALLFGLHDDLEKGEANESDVALLAVWMRMLRTWHEDFTQCVDRASQPEIAPVPLEGTPVTDYADFLKTQQPYASGQFLSEPTDPDRPRYVPEMNETDPDLSARHQELIRLIKEQFGAPRNGMVYERYLEEQHRPDAADLDFLRDHGFFRVPIPKELGGEGRSKADYYLLTVNTHRLADAAISLTIQVNSSLGSTPVLVPRDKELPKAQKDMEAFVADTALQTEIAQALHSLTQALGWQPVGVANLQKRLDEAVLSKPVLRVQAHHFVQAWQDAGRAAKAYDEATARAKLREALAAWRAACATAAEYHDEIGRRRRAADLFCRWVASGQISAFALTEPSAGSDTARVATRAKLRQMPVEAEADGVYRFIPFGSREPRRLIDASRVQFTDGPKPQALHDGAPIHFDEYDYETDAVKKRYFVIQGRRVYFDDIAQLRERQGRLWYDYWELTGAKMWITNGRVMGIMALYAKTEEGVTGFIVDRHAEGLIVGKDEAKMGQNGSPTNELALQSVRVPRENIIGLEGRGQVNALETLNVGRAGLAMSAMSQMIYLCQWSRDFARKQHGDQIPGWIAWRLEKLEEERFIAEALSLETIGRFEHKQTKSVRMESAIAKMLVSELFHHSIELAEEVHGPAGQTQEHLVEKRKRDARILNIYEGTNEIQRFLILRELAELAAGSSFVVSPSPRQTTNEDVRVLDELKARLRALTREAVEHFGQQLWQNPNLQANCFLLPEAAAWIAAAESTLGRLTWLRRWTGSTADLLATGRRALARCLDEVRGRLGRFAAELVRLRLGHYAPEIRAASLLLHAKKSSGPIMPSGRIDRPLSVLVVLDPPTPGVPHPRTQHGALLEPHRVVGEADRAAIETALRLRDCNPGAVKLQAACVASPAAATKLRELLSLGFDRVRLVASEGPMPPDRAAAALAVALHGEPAFEVVLGAADVAELQEGLLARLTAGVLGVPLVGAAAQLAVDTTVGGMTLAAGDGRTHQRALPGAVMMEAGLTLRDFSTADWLRGLEKEIEIAPWPADLVAAPLVFEEAVSASAAPSGEQAPQAILPREASRLVLSTAGIEVATPTRHAVAIQANGAPPAPADVAVPLFTQKNGETIVAVLAADADGKLRPSARKVLDAAQFLTPFFHGAGKAVLLVVPRRQETQQRALAELTSLTPFDITLLAAEGVEVSDEVRCRVLGECWSRLENFPAAVVGEAWCESALTQLATASGQVEPSALRVRLLDRDRGALSAEGSFARGKLRTRQRLTPFAGQTVWIGLTAEAEVGAAEAPRHGGARRIERWSPQLDRFYGQDDMQRLLQELKQAAGLVRLSDAEFIIDVGFGVGNRDGYEAVIEPLESQLRQLGVKGLAVGGSRKVTEELHILPNDRQIGQSGVSVNPRILLAIGVSGAPQHLNYIGPRATIIAFNRDPEAPLMTLNQRQARPRVFPVVGDLFETVPALLACLQEERADAPVQRVRESAAV